MKRAVAAALSALAAPSTAVAAAAEPPVRYDRGIVNVLNLFGPSDEPRSPGERRASELYDRAASVLGHRGCDIAAMTPQATRRRPSAALRGTLAPLRGPATSADRAPRGARLMLPGLYVEWVRRVEAEGGYELYVAAGVDREQTLLPRRCMLRVHARLTRALADEPADVRRAALRLHRTMRSLFPPRLQRRVETVGLLAREPDGTVLPFVNEELPELTRRGVFGTSQAADDPTRSFLAGIAPDGVASVTLTLGRSPWDRSELPDPAPLELTLPVRDNVVSSEIERRPEDAQVLRAVLHRPG